MAVFGGMTLTNKGLVLQGKAQAGGKLNYTRIAVGDGSITGQAVPAMNGLISQKISLPITRITTQSPNKAIIGSVLRNADVSTGFYWREVGVFAQDPDAGEILYAYANAGVTADYIPPGGGSDIIEKTFDCVVVVGTAANITAVIDESLVFAKKTELDTVEAAKVDKVSGKGLSANDYTSAEKNKLAGITAGAGGAGTATDAVIGSRTISDTTAPTGDSGTVTNLLGWLANTVKSITGKSSWRTAPATTLEAAKAHADDATRHITAAERTAWNAKETTAGAQAKADAAQAAAATDATSKANAAQAAAATDAAAKANTVQANLTSHTGNTTVHITAAERSTWNAKASTTTATTSTAGLMAAADKAKLDGVAAGANNYTHPAAHPPSIIVQDANNRFVTDAEKTAWTSKETPEGAQTKVNAHSNITSAHSATAAAIPNRMLIRDGAGRAQVAVPAAAGDIATKGYVDDNTGGSVRTATLIVAASNSTHGGKDGADFICTGENDQTTINAAIAALPPKGGGITLLEGSYNISSPVQVNKNNVSIRGNGNGTELKRVWVEEYFDGVLIVAASGCTIENLQINGMVKGPYAGIYLSNYNMSEYVNTKRTIIKGNFLVNNGRGIHTVDNANQNGAGSNIISNNICIGNDYGISITGSCMVVSNNICQNNNIGIAIEYSNGPINEGNLIIGNDCRENATGILVTRGSNLIIGNNCGKFWTWPIKGYGATEYTIRVTSEKNLITSNVCEGKNVVDEGTDNMITNNKFFGG
ncbi:right-handed parallel beta-helix repeat-containing protein [Paenibacillus sp. FSL M7-0896]|uniref:phage tail-collar fiber domain-containing protein n=1 Tax=Paenibacillus sp. FSL M7-0896 TaxID=2921610 RepID=UPI0030DD66B3